MRSGLPRHVEYFTFLLASGFPENDLREGSPSCCKNHDDVEERLNFGGPIRVWRAADRLRGIESIGEEARPQPLRVNRVRQTIHPQFLYKLSADRLCARKADGRAGEPRRLFHELVLQKVVGVYDNTICVLLKVNASARRELEAACFVGIGDKDVLARRCATEFLYRCYRTVD